MKSMIVIGAFAVCCMAACSEEEKPCPSGNELALQSREDSLNQWEQRLIVREKKLTGLEQSIGNNGGTTTLSADENPESAVKSTSVNTVNTYKANVASKAAGEPKAKYKKPNSAHPGQYPETSERLLTEADMTYQTAWGKKIMLNEIYARKGMIFKEDALARHFKKESWYKGKKASISSKALSAVERQNIAFIEAHR